MVRQAVPRARPRYGSAHRPQSYHLDNFSRASSGWHRVSHAGTSSVITLNPASLHGPKVVVIATSVASRPRAIRMRPMRGLLWRASKGGQRPPGGTADQAVEATRAPARGRATSPPGPAG